MAKLDARSRDIIKRRWLDADSKVTLQEPVSYTHLDVYKRQVFSSVAGNYDLMNDAMSLGIHRVWKRFFVATCQVRKGARVLDLAGGTGDIAALLKDRVGDTGELVLGDINGDMLRVGRDRRTNRGNAVSYTHLDVYKRQPIVRPPRQHLRAVQRHQRAGTLLR